MYSVLAFGTVGKIAEETAGVLVAHLTQLSRLARVILIALQGYKFLIFNLFVGGMYEDYYSYGGKQQRNAPEWKK